MEIVRRLCEFNVPKNDLVHIYILYVRSTLEFNGCVWHFNLTNAQSDDIERVQKTALKIILNKDYNSYEESLHVLKLDTLSDRRKELCQNFATNALKHKKFENMFPLNNQTAKEKYKVDFARTSRLRDSAIPQMQRLLNIT